VVQLFKYDLRMVEIYIKITKLPVLGEVGNDVFYISSVGFGIGLWAAPLPNKGGVYEVEMTIKEKLVWGASIKPSTKEGDEIGCADGITNIHAKILSNENGDLAIELLNSIVMIETDRPPEKLPSRVELLVGKVIFYPIIF